MTSSISTTKPLRDKKILIIEDDHFILRIYNKWLTVAGAEVKTASDGIQGLRILQDDPVDLVLLDLGMPGMDGYQTLAEIRKHEQTKDLPVIVLSNTTMTENQAGFEDIKKAGVRDIMRKYEVTLVEIVERISAYFPQEKHITAD